MGWIVHGMPELEAKSSYRSVNGLVIAFAVLMVITTVLRLHVRRSRLAVDDAIVVLGAVWRLSTRKVVHVLRSETVS